MRKEVEQLALMGAMPDETDEPTDVLIDKYFNQALSTDCFIWDRMDIVTFDRVCVSGNRIY